VRKHPFILINIKGLLLAFRLCRNTSASSEPINRLAGDNQFLARRATMVKWAAHESYRLPPIQTPIGLEGVLRIFPSVLSSSRLVRGRATKSAYFPGVIDPN
jgi:hypothetical protein